MKILSNFIISRNLALFASFYDAAIFALKVKTDHVSVENDYFHFVENDEPGKIRLDALMVGARGVGKTTIGHAWLDGAWGDGAQKDKLKPKRTNIRNIFKMPVIEPANKEHDDNGDQHERKEAEFLIYDVPPHSEKLLIDTDNRMIMECVQSARVVVIVFDIVSPKTLQNALNWKNELEKYTRQGITFILLMNKIDQAEALGVEHITKKETGFGNFFIEEDLARMSHDECALYNWVIVLSSFCKRHGFSSTSSCGDEFFILNLPISSYEYSGMDESLELVWSEALEHYRNFGNEITQQSSPIRNDINVKMYLILPLFILLIKMYLILPILQQGGWSDRQ